MQDLSIKVQKLGHNCRVGNGARMMPVPVLPIRAMVMSHTSTL